MNVLRHLRKIFVAGLVAATLSSPSPAQAVQASGSGSVRQTAPAATFAVELTDTQPLAFSFTDFATDPPRTISFSEPPVADCLGELFGGQTLRLSGAGSDSAESDAVALQVFLVDGGELGPDRLSVKASRADGTVTYFAPLRDLEAGTLVIGCD